MAGCVFDKVQLDRPLNRDELVFYHLAMRDAAIRQLITNSNMAFIEEPDRVLLRLDESLSAISTIAWLDGLATDLERADNAERRSAAPGARFLVLRMEVATLGCAHPNLVASLNKLANCLTNAGRPIEAEPLFRDALNLRREVLGADHPHTLSSLNNLASCLLDLGRPQEAAPLLHDALRLRRTVLGERHPDTIRSLNNLAGCLLDLGRSQEAESFYREGLSLRREVLGPRHPDTLRSLNNLANCLGDLGRLQEAEPLYRETLAIRREVLGDEHSSTLGSINNLAGCLRELGRAGEAEPLYREALDLRRKLLGDRHPHTLGSMNNLANCLCDLGGAHDAVELYRMALDLRRDVLGEGHPQVAESLNNLANCLSALGRANESEKRYRQALDIRLRMLEPRHPSTLTSVNNLAICLCAVGRAKDAEPLCREALNGRREVLGLHHPNTLASLNNFANCLRDLDRIQEAEPLYRAALDTQHAVLGARHPDTLRSLHNLAGCLRDLGRTQEAEPLFRNSLELRREVFGLDHPATLAGFYDLAVLVHDTADRGAEAYASILAGLDAHLESEDPNLDWFSHTTGLSERLVNYMDLGVKATWPTLFARVSSVLTETLEMQVEQVMDPAHEATVGFHGLFMDLCLRYGRTDLIPSILGRIHAPRLATLVWERMAATPSAALSDAEREFVQVRKELSLLRLGGARGSNGGGLSGSRERVVLGQEQAAEVERNLYHSRVQQIEDLTRRYRSLREQLREDPKRLLLVSGERTVANLRALLRGNEGLVLLIDLPTADERFVPVMLLLRPGSDALTIGPRLPDLHRLALLLAQGQDGSGQRAGYRRGILDDEDEDAVVEDPAKILTQMDALQGFHDLSQRLRESAILNGDGFRDWATALRDARQAMDTLLASFRDEEGTLPPNPMLRECIGPTDTRAIKDLAVRIRQLSGTLPLVDANEQTALMQRYLWQPLVAGLDLNGIGDLYWLTHGRLHALPYDRGWGETMGIRRRFHYPGTLFVGDDSDRAAVVVESAPGRPPEQPTSPPVASSSLVQAYHAPRRDDPWRNRPIPFVLTDAAIAAHFLPQPQADLPTLIEQGCAVPLPEGCFAGHGSSAGQLQIGAGRGFAWQDWFHLPLRIRRAYVPACLLGRMDETRSDPIGWVAALLLKDTETVIAALTPVSDFFTPLLSLLYFQTRYSASAPLTRPEEALAEAKRRLLTGAWYDRATLVYEAETTAALVRRFYPIGMEETLRELDGKEPDTLSDVLLTWHLPPAWRARIATTEPAALIAELANTDTARHLCDETLDHLIADRANLPLDDLATAMVCFGRS